MYAIQSLGLADAGNHAQRGRNGFGERFIVITLTVYRRAPLPVAVVGGKRRE